jgi:hypothetical protein
LQSSSLRIAQSYNSKNFWLSLCEIQEYLRLSNGELSDLLNEENLINQKSRNSVSLQTLEKVLTTFKVSAQNFFQRTYDLENLYRKYHYGDFHSIPEKYSKAAYSNFFTLQNIVM